MTDQHNLVVVPADVLIRAYEKALAEYREGNVDVDAPGETWAEFEALAEYLPGQIKTLGDVERLVGEHKGLRTLLGDFVELAEQTREALASSQWF